jgi:ADP-ribose pyrophosphatase YjhB (NUDIX family)
MIEVTKVMMFVWRNNNGKPEFFVLHKKNGLKVVITGHVGDFISDESLLDATHREVEEELGAKPIAMENINYTSNVVLPDHKNPSEKVLSKEHAMLVEIPNVDVEFLEDDQPHQWHLLKELEKVMTYPKQKGAIKKIEEYFRSVKK